MIKLLIGLIAVILPSMTIWYIGKIGDKCGLPLPIYDPDCWSDNFFNGVVVLVLIGIIFLCLGFIYIFGDWLVSEYFVNLI